MTEGISANGIHSYEDFGLYIAERKVTPGTKRMNKKTIPFMHGSYDFSMIAGEAIYDEAELRYLFDIAELTGQEMEVMKGNILDWVLNIEDADIKDDYSPDFYYHGSTENIEWEENFGEAHLAVIFKVYPFKFKREVTTQRFQAGSGILNNKSSHQVAFSLDASEELVMELNGTSYSVRKGISHPQNVWLERGENTVKVTAGENVYLDISYREERFC